MPGYDVWIGSAALKLDFPPFGVDGGASASGTWTFQNSSPTDVRFQNSEPGFGDTAPYSARTWSTYNGSFGKQIEIQAPQDLARSFMCDLDNTRAGKLTPRLRWDQTNGTITFPNTAGNSAPTGMVIVPVDSQTHGRCFIVQTIGGTDAGYWLYRYDVPTRAMVAIKQVSVSSPVPDAYCTGLAARLRSNIPAAPLRETSGRIFMATNAGTKGAIDLMANFPQPNLAGGANTLFWHFVTFGGYLVTFEATNNTGNVPGMTISLRNPADLSVYTPTTLSGIDAAPMFGNAFIQEQVPDVLGLYAPVIYAGAIYAASDREVFKVVFDDQGARLLCVPVQTTFTRITSNPQFYQGSLYVGSGNTLWKWTPGQLEWTGLPIDQFGCLPADRAGGAIVGLQATANGLMIGMVADPGSNAAGCFVRMNQDSVFDLVDPPQTAGVITGTNPNWVQKQPSLAWFVDAAASNTEGPIVGFVCSDQTAAKRVVPVRESNRDPIYLSGTARSQVSGSHFWISPIDVGVGYGDIKRAIKIAAQCEDVTSTCKIRVYYQTDGEWLFTADTLDTVGNGGYGPVGTQDIMRGQGTWHLAMVLDPSNSQLTQIGVTGGWGGYAEFKMTAAPLSFRSIRWCVEIIGDTTGVHYPRMLGLKFYYSETPAIYVVHSVRVRILAGDPDLEQGLTPPAPRTVDDVYTTFNYLWNCAKAGTFVNFRDPNGDTHLSKITKFICNGMDLLDNPDGIPTAGRRRFTKLVLQLALQEADSAAIF